MGLHWWFDIYLAVSKQIFTSIERGLVLWAEAKTKTVVFLVFGELLLLPNGLVAAKQYTRDKTLCWREAWDGTAAVSSLVDSICIARGGRNAKNVTEGSAGVDGKLEGPRTPLERSWLSLIYLADFLKTNPNKICSPSSKKASKGRFLGSISSKIILTKETEKRKRKSEEKERSIREKSNSFTLSFKSECLLWR